MCNIVCISHHKLISLLVKRKMDVCSNSICTDIRNESFNKGKQMRQEREPDREGSEETKVKSGCHTAVYCQRNSEGRGGKKASSCVEFWQECRKLDLVAFQPGSLPIMLGYPSQAAYGSARSQAITKQEQTAYFNTVQPDKYICVCPQRESHSVVHLNIYCFFQCLFDVCAPI